MVVFVCMVGHDFKRIIDGISYWLNNDTVEQVYLLYDKKDDRYGYVSRINVEDLFYSLSFVGSNIISIGYDPQSYQDTFVVLYQVLKKEVDERKRRVLIDTTSTTKEAYGAAVTISLMFKNVRIYIVPPAIRGWYAPGKEDPKFQEWFSRVRTVGGLIPQEIYLPGERIDRPSGRARITLLELLKQGGYSPSITLLINWLGEDASDPVVKNRYSRLIKRLERGGYIREAPSSVGKGLEFTEFGRSIAEAIKRAEDSRVLQ